MSFALYLDEDVNIEVAVQLNRNGFDVLTTRDAGRSQQRLSDESQLSFATERGRAILTHNIRHFQALAIAWEKQSRSHAGIILARRSDVGRMVAGVRKLQEWYPDGIANYCLHLS